MADFPQEQTVVVDPEKVSSASVRVARVRASATLQPCAALVVKGCEGLGLGAVTVYLERLDGSGAVPTVTWALRARHGGASESEPITGATGGLSKFVAWSSEGSVVDVSGRRCLGYELWAASSGSVDIPCVARFVFASARAGVPWFVVAGELV